MGGSITIEHDPRGAWIVVLSGEIDMGDQEEFQAAVDRAWGLSPSIIIDLSGATFFDSTILMVIMQALRRADASDEETIALVVPLRSHANRLLVLSGFTQLLMPIGETRDEVFEAWSADAAE
jgi:anti-anti-sigma factor